MWFLQLFIDSFFDFFFFQEMVFPLQQTASHFLHVWNASQSNLTMSTSSIGAIVSSSQMFPAIIPPQTPVPPQELLAASSIISSSFWASQCILQRLAGAIRLHSGRSAILMSAYGLLSFAVSFELALHLTERFCPSLSKLLQPKHNSVMSWISSSRTQSIWDAKREHIRLLLLSSVAHLAVEQRFFQTAVPSSIISLGVFAYGNRGSVEATSEVATEAQRRAIQGLGQKYGCHHCGSKQKLTSVKR